eukprot:3163813-Rhodomonas_salina.2
MSNPGPEHTLASKHILRYLKATKHLKLMYRSQIGNTGNVLESYADSDHAGDPDTLCASAGHSAESAEAEYYAVSVAGTDMTSM